VADFYFFLKFNDFLSSLDLEKILHHHSFSFEDM
jgi:hypothetical protein